MMDTHQKTVLYKSTDNIMKYNDFASLCSRYDAALTPVLAQQLLRNGQLARATAEAGYEVVKLSPVRDKGLKVTDMDMGILRYVVRECVS